MACCSCVVVCVITGAAYSARGLSFGGDSTGEGQHLSVYPTSPTCMLTGTVRRPRRGESDGLTTFRSMAVQSGQTFTSALTNPPFRIGPLPQSAIDALLAASGGTLAGILVPA